MSFSEDFIRLRVKRGQNRLKEAYTAFGKFKLYRLNDSGLNNALVKAKVHSLSKLLDLAPHPNIATLSAVAYKNNVPEYFALKCHATITLESALRTGRIDGSILNVLLQDIGDALRYLHSHIIALGYVKSENILLSMSQSIPQLVGLENAIFDCTELDKAKDEQELLEYTILLKTIDQTGLYLKTARKNPKRVFFKKFPEVSHEDLVWLTKLSVYRSFSTLYQSNDSKYLYYEDDGTTLREALLVEQVTGPLIWTWMEQIAHGIRYLTHRGLVHGALHPANITDKNGRIEINCLESVLAETRDLCLPYLEPDQLLFTAQSKSPSVDIYSFAVIIWEMVYRSAPILEENITKDEWVCRILDGERPKREHWDQREENPLIDIDHLILSMRARDPADRWDIDDVISWINRSSILRKEVESFKLPDLIKRTGSIDYEWPLENQFSSRFHYNSDDFYFEECDDGKIILAEADEENLIMQCVRIKLNPNDEDRSYWAANFNANRPMECNSRVSFEVVAETGKTFMFSLVRNYEDYSENAENQFTPKQACFAETTTTTITMVKYKPTMTAVFVNEHLSSVISSNSKDDFISLLGYVQRITMLTESCNSNTRPIIAIPSQGRSYPISTNANCWEYRHGLSILSKDLLFKLREKRIQTVHKKIPRVRKEDLIQKINLITPKEKWNIQRLNKCMLAVNSIVICEEYQELWYIIDNVPVNLRTVIQDRSIDYSVDKICSWIHQIAQGLEYLRSCNLRLRNIDTEHAWVTWDQRLIKFAWSNCSELGASTEMPDSYGIGTIMWELIHRRVFDPSQSHVNDTLDDASLSGLIQSCLSESIADRPSFIEIMDQMRTKMIWLSKQDIPFTDEWVFTANRIAQGGQASIHLVNHEKFGRAVYKCYQNGATITEREREIQIMRDIRKNRHRRFFVDCLAFVGTADNIKGLLLEVLHGDLWNKVISDQSVDYGPQEMFDWLWQISTGMLFLHSKNIVHRDIKPLNLLIDVHLEYVKISDFGTITATDHTTEIKGTLRYLDPCCPTTGRFQTNSDVYSFGVTCNDLIERTGSEDSMTLARRTPKMTELHKRCTGKPEERPTQQEIVKFFQAQKNKYIKPLKIIFSDAPTAK